MESYKIATNPHTIIREMETIEWGVPHFFYTLGPPIEPPQEVKTGNLYMNARVWAAIDLLLTSKTIAQARDETQPRLPQD